MISFLGWWIKIVMILMGYKQRVWFCNEKKKGEYKIESESIVK